MFVFASPKERTYVRFVPQGTNERMFVRNPTDGVFLLKQPHYKNPFLFRKGLRFFTKVVPTTGLLFFAKVVSKLLVNFLTNEFQEK